MRQKILIPTHKRKKNVRTNGLSRPESLGLAMVVRNTPINGYWKLLFIL